MLETTLNTRRERQAKNSMTKQKSTTDSFVSRHIGPDNNEQQEMLRFLGFSSLSELINEAVPSSIRTKRSLELGHGMSEAEVLEELRKIAKLNQVYKSYIGMGYSDCITPAVIQRNILENPGWYTQYTPYQAEIAQGRLEALLNFQTMVSDLTGLPIANASLLDEGTAAAEAMALSLNVCKKDANQFFIDKRCHPQTIDIVKTRAKPLKIECLVGDFKDFKFTSQTFGALVQYPDTEGTSFDYSDFVKQAHDSGALVTMAADILALTLLKSPGEMNCDIAIGTTQRFGVPMGNGGPHAAYFATKEEFKRSIPGRLVGVSIDAQNKTALRLALQTREQHIRRDKATSNICTAQVLLAIMASSYAVYHGPKGLKSIAERVHHLAGVLKEGLTKLGLKVSNSSFFDTLKIATGNKTQEIYKRALNHRMNLRNFDDSLGVSLDETTTLVDVEELLKVFSGLEKLTFDVTSLNPSAELAALRKTPFLTHPVFNRYHSETEMLRYLNRLQAKDLSLAHSMIPLGSCTMKLNATTEMIPVTWPEFGRIHPFAPADQVKGYQVLVKDLERLLSEITGFEGISLQPNAGSQGEFAGLLVIHKYFEKKHQSHRDICLIPSSAHGTNPASSVMAGMKVVVVACDEKGNISLDDLKAKANEHREKLAALMITYPSTHGVFEEGVKQICQIVHDCGGLVYMDGANMNAQVGLCRPAELGADVCHLNLHKTFCIPHGGGGPGMGPIGVRKDLIEFLPNSAVAEMGISNSIGSISAAPYGSASILPISYSYILMMGAEGLKLATEVAILNANYIAKRLQDFYPVVFKGQKGYVAHECIVDLRGLKAAAGIEVDDVAKRLIDYGFHAPTVSWPVAGTMMIEPTESESKRELDYFCDAMIAIRKEISEIEKGHQDRENNVLKNAPHTAEVLVQDKWERKYSRLQATYPLEWVKARKFWPSVSRINNPHGDRNLVCACPPTDSY